MPPLEDNITIGTDHPHAFNIYMGLVTGIIILVIEFGNILTIVAVFHYRRLRQKKYTVVISLAITDCLVGFSGALLLLKFYSYCQRSSLHDMLLQGAIRIPILSSMFHLILMGVERFVAIVWPLRFENMVTENTLKGGIAACWIISFLICFGYLGWLPYISRFPDMCLWQTAPLQATLVVELLLYGIIFTGMIIIYGKKICIARAHTRRIQAANEEQQSQSSPVRPNISKGMKLVGLLLSAYLIAWLPYFVVYFIILHHGYSTIINTSSMVVLHFGLANSCVNTLIYAWTNTDFRMAYFSLLCGKIEDDSELHLAYSSVVATDN